MSLLIKNGRIITADSEYHADIFIEHETISLIGEKLTIDADQVIDAAGKYVIPGGIDVHTHLDMPIYQIKSADDFESGTIAAAFGGTTSIVDFATQNRGMRVQDALNIWHEKAHGKSVIDYGFHMIITDLETSNLTDLSELIQEGVSSFKLFMAYPNALMVDDKTTFRVFRHSANSGALVSMHAENGQIIDIAVQEALLAGNTAPIYHALTRSPLTEAEAVHRTIAIAEMAGAPAYIVHLSSARGLDEIKLARKRNLPVFAETCPQYLFLSIEENMGKPGFEDAKYVFTPPLREKFNQSALWTGMQDGDIQVLATDHCPFNYVGHKDLGLHNFSKIPNGGSGIEHRLQLTFNEHLQFNTITLQQWVALNSTNPARLFGLYPQKGNIAIGSDADLVVWNPSTQHTLSVNNHHMHVDYSMYEGVKVTGNAETVISRGSIIIQDNTFVGKKGYGKYISRKPFGSAFQ